MIVAIPAEIHPQEHYHMPAVLLKPTSFYLAGDLAPVVFYPYHGVYFIQDGPNWVPIPREYFKLIGNA